MQFKTIKDFNELNREQKVNFTGKVVFITGGGSGIGLATSMVFAQQGANVVIVGLSGQGNQEVVRLIEKTGGKAIAIKCDVQQSEEVKAALDNTIETFGRLDFAFNNAGIEQPISVQ